MKLLQRMSFLELVAFVEQFDIAPSAVAGEDEEQGPTVGPLRYFAIVSLRGRCGPDGSPGSHRSAAVLSVRESWSAESDRTEAKCTAVRVVAARKVVPGLRLGLGRYSSVGPAGFGQMPEGPAISTTGSRLDLEQV